MKKLIVTAVAVVAALMSTIPASASTRTSPVKSTYTCTKHPVSQNPDGTWTYNELCTLAFTITGPVHGYKMQLTGARGEKVTFSYQSAYVPVSFNEGIMGMSQPTQVTTPYTLNGIAITKGWKTEGGYVATLPVGQPKPVMKIVLTR